MSVSCLPTAIDGDSRRDGRCHGEVGGVAEHVKGRRELAHMGVIEFLPAHKNIKFQF